MVYNFLPEEGRKCDCECPFGPSAADAEYPVAARQERSKVVEHVGCIVEARQENQRGTVASPVQDLQRDSGRHGYGQNSMLKRVAVRPRDLLERGSAVHLTYGDDYDQRKREVLHTGLSLP